MRFRILGPVEIEGSQQTQTVRSPRQRIVLSALLLDANLVVSTDQLAAALWQDTPPTTARGQVQICVSALRKTLAGLGLPDRIITSPPGYLIAVSDGELDLHYFDRLELAAHQAIAQSRLADAVEAFDGALALWRGDALAGVESPVLQAAMTRLNERRMALTEDRIDVELQRGEHHHVVGELHELVTAHPLRERLHAQHMRALFGAGRQADALAAYRSARRILLDELGLEPGGELRRLEQVILAGGDADAVAEHPAAAPAVVPRLLPADPVELTGRDGSLAEVRTAFLDETADVPVVVISGRVGVGKSALALRAAHALAPAYPDGQLYLNMLGADGAAVPPERALGRFLRALGLPASAVPDGLDERAELFRDRLAGQRVLVVLDGVAHEQQALPLLPGSADTAVIITSRRRLTGLAGARQVYLDPLPVERSLQLLASGIGWARLQAEPDGGAALAELCDGLPLALRTAAARLAARPHWTVRQLADRLRDGPSPLDDLSFGGLDLRGRLESVYGTLSPTARLLFRRLGALAAVEFRAGTAGRLLAGHDAAAEDAVEELVDAQLIEARPGRHGQSRYRLTSLVRRFAAERLAAEGPPAGPVAAA